MLDLSNVEFVDSSGLGAIVAAMKQMGVGRLPALSADPATIPEGGFGWFLIYTLSREVVYERENNTNRLTLRFDLSSLGGEVR